MSPARFETFAILMAVERGGLADDLLRGDRVSALTAQDRHLCTALVMGTLRWQIQLDETIRSLLARPRARLDPAIQVALRMGAFQLQWMDRIPAHAAIDESVTLAKLSGHTFAARMVNALLRMLAQGGRPAPLAEGHTAAELAAATAHPAWMVERWARCYGLERARAICAHGQRQAQLAVRLDGPATELELAAAGSGLAPAVELAPGALLIAARRVVAGDVTATEAFRQGRAQVQEEGSQLIAEIAAAARPSAQVRRILDCCAAPGGKTLILAERHPEAGITALEVSPARVEALRTRMAASPFAGRITVRQGDAAALEEQGGYDLVLADVPCSGTGTLGRNPEIRHRLKLEDLKRMHARQVAILRGALHASRGRAVYSTCSLEPEENADVVNKVLRSTPGWRQVSVAEVLAEAAGRLSPSAAGMLRERVAADGSLMIVPGMTGTGPDGFFVAVFAKTGTDIDA